MDEDPEIDIEENALVYPRIESIYSDVNIKAEPIDIEDEYDSIEIAESPSDYYMQIPTKIILGSKPSTLVQSEPIPGPSTALDKWEDQEDFFECVECNLLFPTQNELDSHKMASHSFLVARPLSRSIKTERRISLSSTSSRSYLEDSSSQEKTTRRQKAVKSTAKSALNKTFPILHKALNSVSNHMYRDIEAVSISQMKEPNDVGDGLLCKHCDVRFPNEIALIKHTYELLPASKIKCEICHMKFDSQSRLTAHMAMHFNKNDDGVPSNAGNKLLQCLYCTCFLMYPGFMKKHLLKYHKVTDYAVKEVNYTGKCAVCAKMIKSYTQYNKHVLKNHRKVLMSKMPFRFDSAPVKIKCLLCSQIFTTRYTAYKHKAEKHPEHSQKQTFYTVYDKPIKQLPANSQAVKDKGQAPESVHINNGYIPKQNLFKCNKCQIHFVNCSAALAHSKRCSLAKGDWKCNKCRRTFTMIEKALHTLQHQYSEKFKVHKVCDKVLSKVLCRCPKCELLFDEIAFATHVSGNCIPKNGMECASCNLQIHPNAFAKHRRYHNKYNLSNSSDFILIDFVDASIQNVLTQKYANVPKQKLLYCSNCSCHFYRLMPKLRFHLEQKCKNVVKRVCEICGLTFTRKPYFKHLKIDHEARDLKLDDIHFARLQDMKEINPPMPEFFKCNKCEVRSVSRMGIDNHSCSEQVFVKCSQCSKKYDVVTYEIHSTFHNYKRSKIEDKESSTLLKFYSCEPCNYGFDTYDRVVEHCQNHYTNDEELVTKLCKVCKLNYVDGHDVLHSGRVKFQILKFDHQKLLTEDWLTGFDPLPQDVIENILSRSVYGFLRNVRLELLIEGPAERTVYKCAQCEINFDRDYVAGHTAELCSSSPRFECSSCSAVFKTRFAKNNHINVHVIYGDDITFREIIFNHTNNKDLNEALRTGRQKESLKFRKCQQCKLLIKASDYQAHISTHEDNISMVEDNIDFKEFTLRRRNNLISYKLFKPVNAANKLYTVYKCRSCNGSIMKKANMIRHKCGPPEKYEKCSKCSLYILDFKIKRHKEQHSLIPKFIQKNISIQEFQLLDNTRDRVKKRRRYSSDDDAPAGSRVTVTVSKTYDTRKVTGRPYSSNLNDDSQDSIIGDASKRKSLTTNAYAKKYIKKTYKETIDYDSESEESHSKLEYTSGKITNLSASTLDIESWRYEMKNKLYQCERCFLCFSRKQVLVSHLSECDSSSLSETPLLCDRCDVVFHPSMIPFHEKLHELIRQNPIENYFYLINISTNGVNTNSNLRWLHKCKPCNVNYLNIRSLVSHFSANHTVQDLVTCETCGLQFTKVSRTRHMRIQHIEGNLSRDDLHIEITEKKIVTEGEIHLTAFVKSQSSNKKCTVQNENIAEVEGRSMDYTIEREDSVSIKKSPAASTEHVDEDLCILSPETIIDENEEENDIKVSKDEVEIIDHNLYKCESCSKHYLTKLTLIRHILSASHNGKPLRCDICGLFFGKRTLVPHKSKQHQELQLSREDFIISNLEINQNTINEEVIDTEALNSFQTDSEKSDTSINANVSRNEVQAENLSETMKEIKSEIKSGVSSSINNHIYKCVECSVYYINRRTLLLHIVIKKHKRTEFLRCNICGLLFGSGSLLKHKKIQHEELNLTRKDFIITDVFGSQLVDDENTNESDIKNDLLVNTDDIPLTELIDKEECGSLETQEDRTVKEKVTKIIKLYQCKDCKICMQKLERKLHVCCSDIQKKQCIRCCLSFRNSDVIQHKRLHRKYRDLSRKNFVLIRFGRRTDKSYKIYKCVSCSTHFMSLNALDSHINISNHQTKRCYCKNCGLFFGKYSLSRHIYIHHKKLNLTVQQFNIIYVSGTDKTSPNNEDMGNNANNSDINTTMPVLETIPNVKTVKKLFKCAECDVYFLSRASYYHHIYNHSKLNPTEYIDCNICDFQFLNESLGIHMKSHKDKSFCLDKLLIEEYQPDSTDPLKIGFYSAKDSKLVSTTTHFDNDDENVLRYTDEQLSIIDSTSDEVPKPRADDMVDVEDSSPLNNDSSREEGTLNPIVEVPNLDVCVKFAD